MKSNRITFGFGDEWKAFLNRHVGFPEKLQSLTETLHKGFIRTLETSSPADSVIFGLGRLAVEDFMEILLLCTNGYGIAGMKLQRGLYEKAVTLGYIAKHRDKAEQFLGYYHVHSGKHLIHARKFLPINDLLSPSEIRQVESEYKKAKKKYQEIVCKKCGKTRTRMSWSELDLLSMARESGLDKLYLQCYYEPTLQAHTTGISLATRLKVKKNGEMSFDEGAQHEKADVTLMGAHNLILYILEVQNKYFKMELENEIQERFVDFADMWERYHSVKSKSPEQL